ncbi:MAG: TadE/TadG family type IV pilus assembly protein [Salaquimonas sp.]
MPLNTKKISELGALRYFKSPKIVRRLKDEEDGATAIEFALLAFPFFMLLMAIIESSLLFFSGQVLESAVDDVGRQIRTGQLAENMTETQLRNAICASAAILFKCENLKIDMKVVAKFDDLGDMPEPVDGKLEDGDFNFTPTGPKKIVMVTVLTEWPVYTNYLQQSLSKLESKNALLTAVAVFKTEPYSLGGGTS